MTSDVRSTPERDALRELVALKDIKDGFGKEPFGDHNGARARADYERRKPLAWQRAREVLADGAQSVANIVQVLPLATQPPTITKSTHSEESIRYRATVKFNDGSQEVVGVMHPPPPDARGGMTREEIEDRVRGYFERVRKLGGDTGECQVEGVADWLLWRGGVVALSETKGRDSEMLVRLIELIKAMDMQAARITRVEGAEEVVEGYRFNTGCWHRILGTIAGHEASKWLQTPEGQARVKEAAERARLTIEELRANRPSWDEIKDKRFTI